MWGKIKQGKLGAFGETVLGIMICFVILALVEGGLRVLGVPAGTRHYDPYVGFAALKPLYTVKDGVATTSDDKLIMFNKESFSVKKPVGTTRIFCFGGSTTFGQPYDGLVGFPRWLGDLLKASEPGRNFEVINAGGISYASYRIIPVMEETLAFEPDLMIVYTGQNEFLERRTYSNLFSQGRYLVTLRSRLEDLHIYMLLKRLWQPLFDNTSREGKKENANKSGDAKFILNDDATEIFSDRSQGINLFFRDEEFSKGVINHFRFNLDSMITLCRRAGVPVIFVEPASNLKDMSPFKSEHGPNMTWSKKRAVENQVEKAVELINASSYAEALKILDKNISDDPLYADLHFWRGKALLGLNRVTEANYAFIKAKDLDVCPVRAISAINETIREVTSIRGVPLVKFKDAVLSKTKDGIPGNDCFDDQVHPTVDIYFFIAELLLEKIVEETSLMKNPRHLSAEERKAIFDKTVASMDPDYFQGKDLSLAHNFNWFGKKREALAFSEKALAAGRIRPGSEDHALLIELYMCAGNLERAEAEMIKAEPHFPSELEMLLNSAQLLKEAGMRLNDPNKLNEAASRLKRAVELGQGEPDLRLSLANMLLDMKKTDEARPILEEIVSAKTHPEAFSALASLHLEENNPVKALRIIEEGVKSFPDEGGLMGTYGIILAENKRYPEAISALKKMIVTRPSDNSLYYKLASVYARSGDNKEAVRHLEQAFHKGFPDLDALKNDKNFETLRKSPEFLELNRKLE